MNWNPLLVQTKLIQNSVCNCKPAYGPDTGNICLFFAMHGEGGDNYHRTLFCAGLA